MFALPRARKALSIFFSCAEGASTWPWRHNIRSLVEDFDVLTLPRRLTQINWRTTRKGELSASKGNRAKVI
jgi:hypothetical protein